MANDTESSLGILDLDRLADFDISQDACSSSKLLLSYQQIRQRASENLDRNIRLSLSSPPILLDLTGKALPVFKAPQQMNPTATEKKQIIDTHISAINDSDGSTLNNKTGLDSKYLRKNSSSFTLSGDYFNLGPDSSTDEPSTLKNQNNMPEFAEDSLEVFSPKEISARSSTVSEANLNGQEETFKEPWKVFRSSEAGNSLLKSFQDTFRTGDDALKLIDEAEKENLQDNALEISDGRVFEMRSLENDFSVFTIGENHSHPFGTPYWGKPGSKSNRPSFGISINSPVREFDTTLRDCTMTTVTSEMDSYRQFENNFHSYAVPKSSTAVQKNHERRPSNRLNSTVDTYHSPLPSATTDGPFNDTSLLILELCQAEKKLLRPNTSTPNTRSGSSASSEGSTIVDANACPKSCCNDDSPKSSIGKNSTGASSTPTTEYFCQNPCCSRVTSPASCDSPTIQLQASIPYQWGVYNQSNLPIVAAPGSVVPSPWPEPLYSGTTVQYRSGTSSFPQAGHQQSNICPSELNELRVCLGECAETVVPVHNPWPMAALNCQLTTTGVASNGQVLPLNTDDAVECQWPQQTFTLAPSETKNLPISFVARYPGKMSLRLEIRCTPAYSNCAPNTPSSIIITHCLLQCQVEFPKVQLEPDCVKIQTSSTTSKGASEASSVFVYNYTAVPVTISLQITAASGTTNGEISIVVEDILRVPANQVHCWLNLSSSYALSVRMVAGCPSTGKPSKAEIPIGYKRSRPCIPASISKGTTSEGEVISNVVVSHKNLLQVRELAKTRILLVMNTGALKSTTSKANQFEAKEALPKLKSTRRLICFPAADLDQTRREEILLKNVGPAVTLTVSLQGIENTVFKLCSEDGRCLLEEELEFHLSRDQNLPLTVAFTPNAKLAFRGLLLIRAKSDTESTILIKIHLYGYGGCSKVSLHGCTSTGEIIETQLQSLRFAQGNGEQRRMIVLNKGSRPAFVCVTSLKEGIVDVSPQKFVVLPFSQTNVTITCPVSFARQTLLVFHGEELLRQAIAKRLPNLPRPSLLQMLDASGTFVDQEKVPAEMPYPSQATVELGNLFYKAISHFDLKLYQGLAKDNPRENTMATLLDSTAFNDSFT